MPWTAATDLGRLASKYAGFAAAAVRRQGVGYNLVELAAELAFDWRHGSRTVRPRDLAGLAAPRAAVADGVQYQGASPRLAAALISRLPSGTRAAAFVDYGCGKGRGLLLAADHGFSKLVGVEFAPELAEECRENLRRARRAPAAREAQIHVLDAAEFAPPPGPVVAFMYNPFHGRTLRRVVDRLRQHARDGAEVRIVYLNPVDLPEFLGAGFLETDRVCRRGHLLGVNLLAAV